MSVRTLLVIFLFLRLIGPVMGAEPADDRREVTARELFAAGQYGDALNIYIKLYAERPHPTYLRNIGRCYQNLGDPDRAISSFREYLRQTENLPAAQRTLVEGYIAEMEQLKRQRQDQVTPKVLLSPSPPVTRPAPSEAAANRDPSIAATPPAAMTTTTTTAVEAGPAASRGPARYAVAAASVAALGTGAFFGFRAISKRRDSDAECVNGCSPQGVSLNDQAKTAALVSDVTIGLGLVGAGIAAYLFLTPRAPAPSGATAAGLRLAPEIGQNQAGLVVGGWW